MEYILFGSFAILLVLNIPIAIALGMAGIIALVFGAVAFLYHAVLESGAYRGGRSA